MVNESMETLPLTEGFLIGLSIVIPAFKCPNG